MIENMITNEPVMFTGDWSIDPSSNQTTIFSLFGDKSAGRVRVFMYRQQNDFVSDLIPEGRGQDQQGANRTLDAMSGRVIFYNGAHRDTEIDLTFSVDPLLDSLQKVSQIGEGFRVTNILCSVSMKENMYLLSEIVTRVDMSISKIKNDWLVTFSSSDKEIQLLANITTKLQVASLENYTNKIANYSFISTIIVVWSFSVLMQNIRTIAQNHVLCQSFSLMSCSLSLVWNFFFFSMHFQYSIQGEFY